MHIDHNKLSNIVFRSIVNSYHKNSQNSNDTSLKNFLNLCKTVVDKALLKQKYVSVNNCPFMHKDVTKAITIIKRTILRFTISSV